MFSLCILVLNWLAYHHLIKIMHGMRKDSCITHGDVVGIYLFVKRKKKSKIARTDTKTNQ